MRWLQSDHLLPLVPAMLRHPGPEGNGPEAVRIAAHPMAFLRRSAILVLAPSSSCLK
jgi:hypothetical protein